jgi:hypothetical protein
MGDQNRVVFGHAQIAENTLSFPFPIAGWFVGVKGVVDGVGRDSPVGVLALGEAIDCDVLPFWIVEW